VHNEELYSKYNFPGIIGEMKRKTKMRWAGYIEGMEKKII